MLLTENLSYIATSKAVYVGDLWTMRKFSGNVSMDNRRLNDSETFLAPQEAQVDSSLTEIDSGDRIDSKVVEGPASLTPATTHPGSPVEFHSNHSASHKAVTPILDIPHSNSTVDVSIINITSYVRNIPVPVFLQSPYKGFDKTAIPVYSSLISHPPSGRKVLFDLGIRKEWKNLAPSGVERI